jgi:PAS domain S-box-containing protein
MRILIAEDEAMNRRLLEVSARKWGLEPVIATDGEEAWELLQGPDAPSVAMLDWMMPGIDGVEICRRLKDSSRPRMVYVIMVTTNARPADIIEGLEAGADDYMTKPFDPQELHARVDVGVRVVKLHRELAERKSSLAAAQARLEDRARFEAAVAGMSDGIVTADEGWRITSANRSAELLLNLVDHDYRGEQLEDVLDRFELSVDARELRRSSDETTSLEISRTGGEVTLWIDGRITRLFDEDGKLTDVTLTLRDATDRIDARNQEIRFMNAISHKLRTPLTVIGGSIDVISHLAPEQMSEAWERLLPICQRQVKRLDETIERLLKFRELSAAEPAAAVEPAKLAEVIAGVEETMRERYPDRRMEFAMSVDRGAERTRVGFEDTRQVIEELVDNAVKFSEEEPVHIAIAVRRDVDEMLSIAVTDDGPGIPHEFLDRVFEGYLQIEEVTTGQVRGLGLGLRIVKQVVEAYGGGVEIHSEIEQGTTVTVTLPADCVW